MKNLWISVKITLAMCLLLGVGYVLVLRGVSALAGPNGGQAETLTLDGRVVGAANVGQQFTGGRYFWGRPSAVDYNGGGSGGSNKATTNPEYLADVDSDANFTPDTNVISDGYFHESEKRSAPYFDIDIDGITTK